MSSPTPLLVVDDTRFDAHRAAGHHPERPERLVAARAAVAGLEREGRIVTRAVTTRPATPEELARVHQPAYLERLAAIRDTGKAGHLDADTFYAPGSVSAAEVAAGSTVELVDALLDGRATHGVALVRPPGHHARAGAAMGFCLLNNIAVAAAAARARGVSRIAIVDWDVHHGNGTQEMFETDPSVLYVSTHQFPFYPGTGAALERGAGEGLGYTVNVPLFAGGGDATYAGAFERIILPVLELYRPELVLVSAGFDPAHRDPLAGMEASTAAFRWMAARLSSVAARTAGGRMALVLEGGYDLPSLEAGLAGAIEGMVTGAAPPIAEDKDAADVAQAATAAGAFWRGVG